MSDTPWTDGLRDRWNSDELIHVDDIFDLAESFERESREYRSMLIRLYNDLFVHHKGCAIREFKELFREENYN